MTFPGEEEDDETRRLVLMALQDRTDLLAHWLAGSHLCLCSQHEEEILLQLQFQSVIKRYCSCKSCKIFVILFLI